MNIGLTGCGWEWVADDSAIDKYAACNNGEIVECKMRTTRKEWKERAKAARTVVGEQRKEIQRLQNENDYLRSRLTDDWART